MGQAVMCRKRPGNCALAGSSGTINGDDHQAKAPIVPNKSSNPGTLVATGSMSSITTPSRDTRQATAKLIAIRGSSLDAIGQTGRESGRERVWQYESISVVAVLIKKKNIYKKDT